MSNNELIAGGNELLIKRSMAVKNILHTGPSLYTIIFICRHLFIHIKNCLNDVFVLLYTLNLLLLIHT